MKICPAGILTRTGLIATEIIPVTHNAKRPTMIPALKYATSKKNLICVLRLIPSTTKTAFYSASEAGPWNGRPFLLIIICTVNRLFTFATPKSHGCGSWVVGILTGMASLHLGTSPVTDENNIAVLNNTVTQNNATSDIWPAIFALGFPSSVMVMADLKFFQITKVNLHHSDTIIELTVSSFVLMSTVELKNVILLLTSTVNIVNSKGQEILCLCWPWWIAWIA